VRVSRRLIGAFKKGKQRRVRVRRGADGAIGQKELAQTFVEEGGLGRGGVSSKTLGKGIEIVLPSARVTLLKSALHLHEVYRVAEVFTARAATMIRLRSRVDRDSSSQIT